MTKKALAQNIPVMHGRSTWKPYILQMLITTSNVYNPSRT